MDKDYWLGRWERGETGWHQSEVEPGLVAHFSGLRPTKVLVPLCGKSLDLFWLQGRGHEVVGVELSEQACVELFKEHNLTPQVSNDGSFQVFRAPGLTVYNGDFFDLTPMLLQTLGGWYDRAALIALPPELRTRYAGHVTALVEACAIDRDFMFLQIVLERTPHWEKGPPFSVPLFELERLYAGKFEILPLSRETVEMGEASPDAPKTEECIYRLRWRSHDQVRGDRSVS